MKNSRKKVCGCLSVAMLETRFTPQPSVEYSAPSVSAQDASPKDGWQIEIVPDPPYPPIVRVRSPEGVARVLTEGDGVLYRYFHKVALAALEVPK